MDRIGTDKYGAASFDSVDIRELTDSQLEDIIGGQVGAVTPALKKE
jgi:hypothetical protein